MSVREYSYSGEGTYRAAGVGAVDGTRRLCRMMVNLKHLFVFACLVVVR